MTIKEFRSRFNLKNFSLKTVKKSAHATSYKVADYGGCTHDDRIHYLINKGEGKLLFNTLRLSNNGQYFEYCTDKAVKIVLSVEKDEVVLIAAFEMQPYQLCRDFPGVASANLLKIAEENQKTNPQWVD